jgi:RNA recognition motif-containing protein
VGGLGFQTSEQELMAYFEAFGKVENTIVMRDKATGRGRGFGFVLVTFRDENEAKQKKDQILNQNKQPGHII